MPPESSTACRLISRPPITSTAPKGTTANGRKSGNTPPQGASQCRKRSAAAGTMSSLVRSFSGSAIRVFTMPRLNGKSPPNTFARSAPPRSWMRAEPLRSIHSRRTVTCRQMSRATSAVPRLMIRSTPAPARVAEDVDRPSVPFQRPHPPDWGDPPGQNAHEAGHPRETEPPELAVGDRPWIHEHPLDVEENEQDRREVELDRKPRATKRADRRIARLEDLVL